MGPFPFIINQERVFRNQPTIFEVNLFQKKKNLYTITTKVLQSTDFLGKTWKIEYLEKWCFVSKIVPMRNCSSGREKFLEQWNVRIIFETECFFCLTYFWRFLRKNVIHVIHVLSKRFCFLNMKIKEALRDLVICRKS